MVVMSSPHISSSPEFTTLRALARSPRPGRPNLLVLCDEVLDPHVFRELVTICAPPMHVCLLPGKLELPQSGEGTLFLHDVAALTLTQQVALYDWLDHDRGDIQIVSLTRATLPDLVRSGAFFEALFYRLNVVTVRTTALSRD
jgi:transcriptional regulator of aromatic amino acid metabolism